MGGRMGETAPASVPPGRVPLAAVHWLSGLAGGTAQVIVGHPFDTIKVATE